MVQDAEFHESDMLRRAVRNMPLIDPLPARGLNVFDILRHRTLLFTQEALEDTIQRCLRPALRGFKRPGETWQEIVARRVARRQEEMQRRTEVREWLRSKGAWVPEKQRKAVGNGTEAVRMMDVDAPEPAQPMQ